jgi:hypothetical protein
VASSGNSYQQRKRLDAVQQPELQEQQPEQQSPDLEGLDQGQELTAEMAAALAPQIGNLGVLALLGEHASGAQELEGQDEEEEQVEERVEAEEVETDLELDGAQFGGGGGGADAPSAPDDNPWDVGQLFGDDDEEDDSPTPQRRRAAGRRPAPEVEDVEDEWDALEREDEGTLTRDDVQEIDTLLGPLPQPEGEDTLERQGDARYRTVEAALQDPSRLGRRTLEAEDLVDTADVWDPIGRPVEIGAFLATAADSPRARSLARLLSRAGAALMPSAGGYSGGVARLANLAVCASAAEGGGARTDRAVALSMEAGVWDEAITTARPIIEQGRLHAHTVLDALRGPDGAPERPGRLPPPSALGGRALARILPVRWIPPVPPIDVNAGAFKPDDDADLAELDDAIALLITGARRVAPGPETPIDPMALYPARFAARQLMNAIGRSHVELAAAAFAVGLVRPGAPVRPVLSTTDRALTRLVRAVLKGGRKVESLTNVPRGSVPPNVPGAIQAELAAAREALSALRVWALASLAGAMDS